VVEKLYSDCHQQEFPGTIILGKPTDNEIHFSLLPTTDMSSLTVQAYSSVNSGPLVSSHVSSMKANEPVNIALSGLTGNTKYEYSVFYTDTSGLAMCTYLHSFQTQRAPGSSFRFAVVADSHLGTVQHCNPARYAQTLMNVNNDGPDFLISLGDDFRADFIHGEVNFDSVGQLYRNQRPFFNLAAQDAFLFNVNGNHELQSGFLLDGSGDNVAIWAINNRLTYFPNPRPNSFYSGDSTAQKFVINGGLSENYYAWTWGNALFVILDNYLYSIGPGLGAPDDVSDGWDVSLGLNQFQWLEQTVAQEATFKFVFNHHINGISRGGIEWVDFFEWGGRNREMVWQFDIKRQGWGGTPIHQTLVKHGVDIVFQGHDHLFVKQDHPDGIVYLTAPMPAYEPDNFWGCSNDNSGLFMSGDILAPSGHLIIDIDSRTFKLAYILSKISGDDPVNGANGETAYSFTIEK